MVAFVGSSGVGKTTLLNLLPRFYDPTRGTIKFDDQDVRHIKVKDLRARLKSDAVDVDALENEVYDHLFSFFRRYYSEGDFLAKRVQTALDRVRGTLAPVEQVILRMRFEDSVPVADIARTLHLNQKRLYRTIEQLLATLRRGLEAEGLQRDEMSGLFADGVFSEVEEFDPPPQRRGAAGTKPPERGGHHD
jgi:energy-coupling factor transporter ATP-binding protein EcfA2